MREGSSTGSRTRSCDALPTGRIGTWISFRLFLGAEAAGPQAPKRGERAAGLLEEDAATVSVGEAAEGAGGEDAAAAYST